MATTTGGTTYVTSTDLVANYPTASLSLANRVDVVASGGPNSIKTSGYTITLADILGGNKFLYNSASPGTFTLPTSGLVDGMVVNVAQIGAGALTVSGGTIVGTTVTTAQYQGLQFVYASTGTTWYSVAPNATAPGLAVVAPTSIANSGGSASASAGEVTFTGVNSVSLNGVFTTAYRNYQVVWNATGGTASGAVYFRYRAAGTDNTTSSYNSAGVFAAYAGGAVNGAGYGSSAFSVFHFWNGGSIGQQRNINLFDPQSATNTSYGSVGSNQDVAAYYAGFFAAATQFDGITIYPSSGNMTGTVRVYGLKNS
jgi:hypothetical protein